MRSGEEKGRRLEDQRVRRRQRSEVRSQKSDARKYGTAGKRHQGQGYTFDKL